MLDYRNKLYTASLQYDKNTFLKENELSQMEIKFTLVSFNNHQ